MGRQIIVYSYNRIQLSNKKVWIIDIHKMSETQEHAEYMKSDLSVYIELFNLIKYEL